MHAQHPRELSRETYEDNRPMAEETLRFETDVGKILRIVANSLYSDKQIFLRELISNASDACDRLRYLAITDPSLIADDPEFRVVVTPDKNSVIRSSWFTAVLRSSRCRACRSWSLGWRKSWGLAMASWR